MSVDNIQTNLTGLGIDVSRSSIDVSRSSIDVSRSNSRITQQNSNKVVAVGTSSTVNKTILPVSKQTQLNTKKDAVIVGSAVLDSKNKEKLNTTNKQDIAKSLAVINKLLSLQNTNLIFRYDKKAKIPIIMVVDKQTKKVISEIPSKNLQKIAQALNDMVESMNKSGVLFNSKV